LSIADLQNVNMINTSLIQADLKYAKLQGTLLPWRSGLMEGVQLARATGCVPADKDLRSAKLLGADLSGSNLTGVKLNRADLRGYNLSNGNLSSADLQNVNLMLATLTNVNLRDAKLEGACLPLLDFCWCRGCSSKVQQGRCQQTETCAMPRSRAPTCQAATWRVST